MEQFWPDALPAAANDSWRYQRELNPSLLSVALATERRLSILENNLLQLYKIYAFIQFTR